jgi:transposase
MSNITVGIDLAKRIFHVALMKEGEKTRYVKLKRKEVLPYFLQMEDTAKSRALIGLEACGGCHFWARSLQEMGFRVRMLKPIDVKAYAKSKQKNDQNDALAIAKATLDKELKAVHVKTQEQQEVFLLHKLREAVIAQRVEKANRFIAFLHEFGYVPSRNSKDKEYLSLYLKEAREEGFLSETTFTLLEKDLACLKELYLQEAEFDKQIIQSNKTNEKAQKFTTVKGIGMINASILSVLPMETYETDRDFAASLGLVPKQNSTGGRTILGNISKRGDSYVRKSLIQGARTIVIQASRALKEGMLEAKDKLILFAKKLLRTKSFNKVAVAVANKMARIVWAMNKNGCVYNAYKQTDTDVMGGLKDLKEGAF